MTLETPQTLADRFDQGLFNAIYSRFGSDYHPRFRAVYFEALRGDLSDFAQRFWDKRVGWFGNRRGSFDYHGLSGIVARSFRAYLKMRPRLAGSISELFDTRSLDDQRRVYDTRVGLLIWTAGVDWTLSRQLTRSMLGVPHAQRKEVQDQHHRGVAGFVQDAVEYVVRQLPVWTNYFWSVYVRGRYTEDCCPEYLKLDNFATLKEGLADRIKLYTGTVTDLLKITNERISKLVLLDHMRERLPVHELLERRAPVRYLLGLRAPYYLFVGRTSGAAERAGLQ